MKFYLVVSTVPSSATARKLALSLIQNRLAACVNVIPGVTSFFRWQGKIDTARESLLFIKTSKPLFPRLMRFLREHHPYQVPEIVSFLIEEGNPEYLRWIEETLKRSRKPRIKL